MQAFVLFFREAHQITFQTDKRRPIKRNKSNWPNRMTQSNKKFPWPFEAGKAHSRIEHTRDDKTNDGSFPREIPLQSKIRLFWGE